MFKELNEQLEKFLEDNKYPFVESPIANKYGGSRYIPSGSKIGNYKIVDSQGKDLIISGQITELLKELSEDGGYGNVTSIMEGSHAGSIDSPRSHYSGNKMDLGLTGKDEETVIKQSIPILLHPAVIEVCHEALSFNADAVKASKDILAKIVERCPEIQERIDKKELKVQFWGKKYASFAHLDVLINPEKLRNKPN